MQIFLIVIAVIAISVIYAILEKISRNRKNKQHVRQYWGKIPQREYKENDFQSISCYYQNQVKDSQDFFIDDITWNDLDMDRVYARINNTGTDVGEEYLYYRMRVPIFEQDRLSEMHRLIEFFRNNSGDREKIQILLSKLGKLRFLNISEYIAGNWQGLDKSGLYYKVLAMIFLLSPILAIFSPWAIVLFFLSMVVNVSTYFRARNRIVGHLQPLAYIVNMIGLARRLSTVEIPEIENYTAELGKCAKRIKGASLGFFPSIIYTTENYFAEIIKIFFLGEPIAYQSIHRLIEKYRKELESIYETIGLLDSLISVASFRESLEYFTIPQLRNSTQVGRGIEFSELYHPLIENPVSNTLTMDTSILVTGSNASGKSTFLKAVAINAILAQTINTCMAKEYSSAFFRIYSSMALSDNLEAKESYYIVEIKSLKRIIDGLREDVPCLCVVDEVLRGTNTIERIAASSELVRYLAGSNCLCVCATHDLELAQILKDCVENYHFQEFFEDNEIKFDYKIYPGRSTTRNAIKLLKILGYSQEIVSNAEKRARLFSENGRWNVIS